MMIGLWPRPSGFGKGPFKHNATVLKSLESSNLYCNQFRRQFVTKKRNILRFCPYTEFLKNLHFRKSRGNYPSNTPIAPSVLVSLVVS